jgi:hypothetical protein
VNNLDILIFVCTVAAVSGVTPTLLSVFTSLSASTLGKGHNNTKIWYNSLAFFSGFIGTITIIGTAFWILLDSLEYRTALYVCLGFATIAIVAAVVEIKDYFWYGRGISHKPHKKLHATLHARTSKKYGVVSSFLLGIVAVAATASNIGIVTITLACLLFTANRQPNGAWFLLIGIGLVAGSFFTLISIISKTKISAILKWKEDSKATMRLGSGLALIAASWLILLLLNHTLTVAK